MVLWHVNGILIHYTLQKIAMGHKKWTIESCIHPSDYSLGMNWEDIISNKKEDNIISKKFLESFLVDSSKFRSM